MAKEIEITSTPEEQELHEKLEDLSALEAKLAQEELNLVTLSAELQALKSRYTRLVGRKFAELDRINAEIAEILAARKPEDIQSQSEAQAARERAEDSERETGEVTKPRKVEAFKPTKELKELYRKIAKMVHPDLAVGKKDHERRTRIMAEVNKAYKEGDAERLEAILSEWAASPEAVEGEDIGSRLVRTIRMLARVKYRIAQIEKDIQHLMQSDYYELKLKVEVAENEGRNLIEEMAAQLDIQIQYAKKQSSQLRE